MNLSSTTLYEKKYCKVAGCHRIDLYGGEYCQKHTNAKHRQSLMQFLKNGPV